MPSLNSYICPTCSNPFPFFISPSMRIRRGLLSPGLKCSQCGSISRPTINVSCAIWIWPLAAALLVGSIHVLRKFIYHKAPAIYLLLVILLLGPFFIVLRKGWILVNIDEVQAQQSAVHKWIIPTCGLLITSFLLGYYTHDWLNVAIGLTVGLIVWALFYHSSKMRE